MTIKKICIIIVLILLVGLSAWIGYQYFHTSKQVYEGILVSHPLSCREHI